MIRQSLAIAAALALFAPAASAAEAPMEVYKTQSCGCCVAWMEHLEEHGFETEGRDMASGLLARLKIESGIAPETASCHTALIDGYVIEGHVPAEDIRRLLEERPDAVGLSVPGMPLGSPGMDQGPEREAYDVLLIREDGSTEVFAHHPGG
jgi:hypothetical protein